MASDNYDDFDIDIYGNDEASPDASNEQQAQNDMDIKQESSSQNISPQAAEPNQQASETQPTDAMHVADNADQSQAQTQAIKDETPDGQDDLTHNQDVSDFIAPTQEMENLRAGEKSPAVNPSSAQKAAANDDRPLDPGATSALTISDMMWWNTDNEITGWAVDSGCEEELKDITFCEHKQTDSWNPRPFPTPARPSRTPGNTPSPSAHPTQTLTAPAPKIPLPDNSSPNNQTASVISPHEARRTSAPGVP